VAREAAGEGIDTIQTSLGSYALGASSNIENLVYTGSAAFKGTGNSLANVLTGGSGNDVLGGGAGSDTLLGGLGNDTLTGCLNALDGGRGEIDRMTGGAGADVFVLGSAIGAFYDDGRASSQGTSDYALIEDFTVGTDRLQLHGVASGYYLNKSTVTAVSGVALWAERGQTDELIAIIRSANSSTLTAANTINTAVFV